MEDIMDERMEILEQMKRLGFTSYECKTYLALLEEHPLNGYGLSKLSGVPRSRIYEVLQGLIEKELVFEQTENTKQVYYPIDPELFIRKLRGRYDRILDELGRYTSTIYRQPRQDDKLVVIQGRDNIISFLKVLISGARTRIAFSIWDEELTELTAEIDEALERGVKLRGIYFGRSEVYPELVPHRRIERYMAEKNERYLSVIIDHAHVVSGIVSRGALSKATWSRDEGVIEVSEDYISHDLVVNLYSASLDVTAYTAFEKFADRVHDWFYHYRDIEFPRSPDRYG